MNNVMFQVKEMRTMKKTKDFARKALKKVVEKSLVADVNRTSCSVIYQPKAPAKLENYKKTNV